MRSDSRSGNALSRPPLPPAPGDPGRHLEVPGGPGVELNRQTTLRVACGIRCEVRTSAAGTKRNLPGAHGIQICVMVRPPPNGNSICDHDHLHRGVAVAADPAPDRLLL